jgi:hypothetical protein
MSLTTATVTDPGEALSCQKNSGTVTNRRFIRLQPGTLAKFSKVLMVIISMISMMSACGSMPGFSSTLSDEEVKVAIDFAQALVEGDYELANSFLAPDIRSVRTPEQLRQDYEGMISIYSNPGSARVVFDPQFTMTDWPGIRPGDVGWAYVSIVGDGFVEAVTVVIAEYEDELLIREIEWGRP